MSIDNRSMPIINSPRTRPMSELNEKWKTSSPSLSSTDSGWKTSSSQSNKSVESWKMSAKPRHAQLPETSFKRHSAMPDMMSTRPKPLPQEPFHLNTLEFSTPIQSHMSYPAPYLPNEMMYTTNNTNEYPPPIMHYSQPQIDNNYTMDNNYPMDNGYQAPPIMDNSYPMVDANYQQQPIYNTPPIVNDAMYSSPALVPSISATTSQEQPQHSPPTNNKEKKNNGKKAESKKKTSYVMLPCT